MRSRPGPRISRACAVRNKIKKIISSHETGRPASRGGGGPGPHGPPLDPPLGVGSGCGEQEAGVASGSGWNLWVWLLGVVVRRYIDFFILLISYPYSSCICSFLQQHTYFLFILLNVFRSCSSTFL